MPGIVTKTGFRLHNAEQLIEALSEASPTNFYAFIGRVTAWPAGDVVPTPVDDISNTHFSVWQSMMAMKKLAPSDATHCISRRNWATGTGYFGYRHDYSGLFSAPFYVYTDDGNIYKCLANSGVASTVKPTGTSTSIITTADGYQWKFMYTITAAEAVKFVTDNYLPVKTLSANDGSAQWTVQQAAANGSVDHIKVVTGGTGYLTTANTISTVTNSTVLVLKSNASATDDVYNDSAIYINSGLGAGQIRRVINYIGASRTATVNGAFTTLPNTSSGYIVAPRVLVRGDGVSALAYPTITAGAVATVNKISGGQSYGYANAVIAANSSHGSGATLLPIISPPTGHGSDPVLELGGYNVMLNIRLSGTEGNTFPTNNDFRVLGLLANPRLRSNGALAVGSSYNQCTQLTLNILSGPWTIDEFVNGGTSAASARVVRFANTNAAGTKGVLHLTNLDRTFSAGETITGNTSLRTANVVSIAFGSLRPYKGRVHYVQNRTAAFRSSDQTEDFKLVIRY